MSNRKSWEPPAPKPYEFVTLPADIQRGRPAGHDAFKPQRLNGTIVGVITALSPVHVASGLTELTGKAKPSLVKAHFKVEGAPVIPATSLKGAIRSIVEAISPSCLRITRARYDQQPRPARACGTLDNLCPACRLFGSLGYLGQVRFSDAVQRERQTEIRTVPPFYAPRTRERLYTDAQGQVIGRKFYKHGKLATGNVPIEACPTGSHFDFSVTFENLTPAELGLLLTALGQGSARLHPKLGGAKPACLGTMEIALGEVKLFDPKRAYTSLDVPFQPLTADTYIEAATRERLVDPDQLRKVAEVLTYPTSNECPDRNY